MKISTLIGGGVVAPDGKRYVWDRGSSAIGYLKENNELVLLKQLKGEESFYGFKLFYYENNLYISSQFSVQILKYDLEMNEFKLFSNDMAFKQYDSCFAEDKIIFIPHDFANKTYSFNLVSFCFEEIDWYKDCAEIKRLSNLVIENQVLFFSDYNTNKLFKVDLDHFDYEIIQFDNDVKISALCMDSNQKLWLISHDNQLIGYENGRIEKITLDEEINPEAFSNLVYMQGKIICIPRYSKYLYIYHTIEKSVDKFDCDSGNYTGTASFFNHYIQNNEILTLLPWGLSKLCNINIKKDTVEFLELEGKEGLALVHYQPIPIPFFAIETEEHNVARFITILDYIEQRDVTVQENAVGRIIFQST